jgi:hypothetical protein
LEQNLQRFFRPRPSFFRTIAVINLSGVKRFSLKKVMVESQDWFVNPLPKTKPVTAGPLLPRSRSERGRLRWDRKFGDFFIILMVFCLTAPLERMTIHPINLHPSKKMGKLRRAGAFSVEGIDCAFRHIDLNSLNN